MPGLIDRYYRCRTKDMKIKREVYSGTYGSLALGTSAELQIGYAAQIGIEGTR